MYRGEPVNFPVTFSSDPLVPYGLSYADIVDTTFNLKLKPHEDEDAKYLQLTTPLGLLWNEATHQLLVQLDQADTVDLNTGRYTICIAVRVTDTVTYPNRIELRLENPILEITPDHNRD